jgi:peptidoglycan-associated lipoprotein
MRILRAPTFVFAAAAAALVSGCATSGALRRATEQQQQALASERAQRMASDSALRQELQAELGNVRGDVVALRNELQAMRTDLNAKITAMQDGLHFDMPVNFAYDDASVRDADAPTLTRFAKVVTQYYPGSKVTIEGFADPKGSTSYNLALSQRRANAVRDYLVAHGLSTNEVATVGYGKTRLVAPGAWGDQPGAELNRRAVFVIETKGQSSVAMATPDER